METITKTDKQVEIERVNDKADCNYRIVWGNPLNREVNGEMLCNWLKINDYAVSTSGMEIGEYNKEITIKATSDRTLVAGVNIVLED